MTLKIDINDQLDSMQLWMKKLPKGVVTNSVRSALRRSKPPLRRITFNRAKQLRNVSNQLLKEKRRTSIFSFFGGTDISQMHLTFRFSHRGIGLANFQTKRNIGQTTVLKGRATGQKRKGKKSGLPKRQRVKVRVTRRKRITLKSAWVGRAKGNLLVLQRKGAKVIALPPVYMNAVMREARAWVPITRELAPIVAKRLTRELDFRIKKARGLISKTKKKT